MNSYKNKIFFTYIYLFHLAKAKIASHFSLRNSYISLNKFFIQKRSTIAWHDLQTKFRETPIGKKKIMIQKLTFFPKKKAFFRK